MSTPVSSTDAGVYYYPVTLVPRYQPNRFTPALLFLLTCFSTTVVGARLQYNFNSGAQPFNRDADIFPFLWAWHNPHLLALGLPFSAALIAILLAHELGHYLTCRHYQVPATYPHFLPAPTLIGTFGAFIRIRAPFRNRRQLFDVAVAGPLAGFAVAVPLLLLGLFTSRPGMYFPSANLFNFGWSPAMLVALHWTHPGANPHTVYLSPIARAAWVGLLATMLNLIPVGQLDGGHIVYAFFPRLHRALSWAAIPILALAGWRYWSGWYVWAVFALIMSLFMRRPRNYGDGFGHDKLGLARVGLALLAGVILLLSFVGSPILGPK